jgi:hypothetical protein
MEPLVKLMPTYWLNRAFRQVTVYRAPVSAVAVDVAVLSAIAVVTIAFASSHFGRLKPVASVGRASPNWRGAFALP